MGSKNPVRLTKLLAKTGHKSNRMVPLGPSGATPPATPLNRVDKLCVHHKSLVIDLEAEA